MFTLLHGGVSRREKFAWLYREVFHREITPEEMEDCCARFVSYALDNVLNAPLVPGVMDVLERWHGRVPMYVCSGTPQEELQSVLEQRGLARYFTGICGTPPAKAELLKGIVRKERIDPADAVMVGDATTDSDAAEAAETLFYGRGPFFENTAYPHGSDLTGLNRWLEELAGKE